MDTNEDGYYAWLLDYILQHSCWTIDDIADVIGVSNEILEAILQNESAPNPKLREKLLRLYVLINSSY